MRRNTGVNGNEGAEVFSISLPVTPVIPPQVVAGQTIRAAHENQVVNALSDLWTDVQALGLGAVPSTRRITVNTPLTGGGTLAADIVINLDTSGLVPTSRKVIAGTGLSGGGDLTADRTFSVNSAAIAGGIQTPWLQDVSGGGHSLSSVVNITATGAVSCASIFTSGAAQINGIVTVGFSGGGRIDLYDLSANGHAWKLLSNADVFQIQTAATTPFTINWTSGIVTVPTGLIVSAGSIGVGINTPLRPLHIANVPGGQGIAVTGVGPCTQMSNGNTEPNTNSMTTTYCLATAAGHFGLNAGDIGLFNQGTARGNIVISANYSGGGTNRFLLLQANGGYTGVGFAVNTTSLLAPLHVLGGILAQDAGGAGPWYTACGYNPTSITSGTCGGMWLDSVTNTLRIEAITPGVVWRNISFCGSGSAAGATGRVSIGWPVPYNPLGVLDVNFAPAVPCVKAGSIELISIQPGISGIGENITYNGAAWIYRTAGTGTLIQWYASGITFMTAAAGAAGATAPLRNCIQILNGGNVGINSSNPVSTLDVGGIVSVGVNGGGRIDLYDINASGHMFKFVVSSGILQIQNVASAVICQMEESGGRVVFPYSIQVNTTLVALNAVQFSNLPSANPGAGTKQLWYDPADGNRIKYAV